MMLLGRAMRYPNKIFILNLKEMSYPNSIFHTKYEIIFAVIVNIISNIVISNIVISISLKLGMRYLSYNFLTDVYMLSVIQYPLQVSII